MSQQTTTDLERLRPKLLAVAYRMLGSAADAEDAVQDAFLRYQGHVAGVASPEAWLVRTTTRLCIDRLRSSRREEYVGQWLPEPVPDAWEGAGADRLELAESLSMAFLVLLETLSPAERAAYLLREVFGHEFGEIAGLLETSPVNARQLVSRAGKRLAEGRRRFRPDAARADELAGRFFAACQSGNMAAIESMLSADVALYADGGGKAFASPRPVVGVRRVARLLSVVFRKLRNAGEVALTTVNGRPGAMFTVGDRPVEILTFADDGERIDSLYVVLNPDKLRRWPSPSSAEAAVTTQPSNWEEKRHGTETGLHPAGPGALAGDAPPGGAPRPERA
jgi:RNA polymerase sigma-70 factor (ECF subfamily)